ncbi:MAG: hypothetical protein NW206_17575 [Hyphomonadaceae bacterium]|nr:hypothetical protein [Hyphomonadaceae bacterium]
MFRTAAVACITALMASVALPAAAEAPAQATCAQTNFRVYFEPGATSLNDMAMDTINAAARNMEGCAYAELHVNVDASSPYAARRGQAVLAAANGHEWDVARVEPRMMTPVAYSSGPDFVDVVMTPDVLPVAPNGANAAHVGA